MFFSKLQQLCQVLLLAIHQNQPAVPAASQRRPADYVG
jgi:hypothetical protein